MSLFRSDIPSIQEELDHYVKEIMDMFKGNGECTKEQVLNFLIEKINQELFNHVETEGETIQENALHRLLGTPEEFTKKLLVSKNLEWPSVGWHENKTSINDFGDINRFANIISPIVMKGIIFLHIALVIITGVFIGIFVIETIIVIEYSQEIYYWYRSMAMIELIITYSLIGGVLYPMTAMISKRPFFRYSWDNMNQWVNIIEITKKIQWVTFNLYMIFFFSSTVFYFTEHYDYDYDYGTSVSYTTPMSGYTTYEFISIIFPFVFIFYLGLAYYKNNIQGSELRPISKSDKYKFKSKLALFPLVILLYYMVLQTGLQITGQRDSYYNSGFWYYGSPLSTTVVLVISILILNAVLILLVKFNKISLIYIKSNMILLNQLSVGLLPFELLFIFLQYQLMEGPFTRDPNYITYGSGLIFLLISIVVITYVYFYRRILEKIIILLKLNERIVEKNPEIMGVDKHNAGQN
jgi:hypothetical protein